MEIDPDADLVARAQAGDDVAFELLVVKHQRRIERLLARMVRDVDMVADLTQDAFFRAYQALPNFRGDSAFYTWLHRIAANTAKNHLVRERRDRAQIVPAFAYDDATSETFQPKDDPSDGETPETLLASRQVAANVNAAVDALAEDFRRALLLREVEGMSYEEIAALMQCPVGTVRSRIFRAREAVAARLRPLLTAQPKGRW